MKAKDILGLTDLEISERISSLSRDCFELRLKKQVDGSKDPSAVRAIKKNIARLKTILKAKQSA